MEASGDHRAVTQEEYEAMGGKMETRDILRVAMMMGHYYSVACIHERHARCDLVCGECGDICRCECHEDQEPALGMPA